MSTVFYTIAILVVMAFPLSVPTTVTIVHAIRERRQKAAAAHPAVTGAVRPAVTPALAGAVPAAA